MESGDPGARQSTSTSANNSDSHPTSQHSFPPPPSYREPSERPQPQPQPQPELPAMATATILKPSPSTPGSYPPPPSYPSSYLPPASSMSSSSQGEPRRSPEEKDATAARNQSLPSISEVISKTTSQYPAPPPPPPAGQPNSNSSFPSPFPGPPRLYAEADKHVSPQGAPSGPPSYGARREPLPAFTESPRAAFNIRPPLPALPERRTSPSIKAEYSHSYAHEAHKDPRAANGAYPHAVAPPPPPPANSYPSGPLPQGQMPLPSYPPSPRHAHQHNYSGYDQRPQNSHMEDGERGHRPQYETRYSAPWNYGETLGRIAQSARTTFQFAEAYGRIAQEQHGPQPIPERLPTDQELADIRSNHEMQRCALDRLTELIAQSINERAREPPRPKAPAYPDEQDVPMFEDGTKGTHFNISEVKKRRGRAAPPGRCHSCNRVDTPEWRRGPDGARTLCNACGLHYAKLERKRQLEQRNIRPKPEDRN